MKFSRLQRTLALWFALVALLLATLGPAIGRVVGAADGRALGEVCTAQGAVSLRGGGPAAPASQHDATHLFEHCPACSLHSQVLGLPPATVRVPLLPLVFEAPRRLFAAPHTPYAWLAAQPRGPPENA